jgi:hypothetical protein
MLMILAKNQQLDGSSDPQKLDKEKRDEPSKLAFRAVLIALAINTGIILIRGLLAEKSLRDALTYGIGSVVVAGAALVIGAILGFIFGIPRAMAQQEASATPGSDTGSDDQKGESRGHGNPGYRPNTNLEQISDWLTKILVGVGLTNMMQIPAALTSLSVTAAPIFGTFSGNNVYALAVMLFFTVSGFLIGFLWARIYLPVAFALSDQDVAGISQKIIQKIDEKLDAQTKRDIAALQLAQKQLDLTADASDLPQDLLDKAFKQASPTVLEQIFFRARNIRHDTWDKPDKLPQMERTIAIFRALAAEDEKKKFHTILGQLGFALADKRQPDYDGAIIALTEAINRRGEWQKNGWAHYELVRATSRIRQNPPAGDPAMRDTIIGDLRAVARSGLDNVLNDPDIQTFLAGNGLTTDALK